MTRIGAYCYNFRMSTWGEHNLFLWISSWHFPHELNEMVWLILTFALFIYELQSINNGSFHLLVSTLYSQLCVYLIQLSQITWYYLVIMLNYSNADKKIRMLLYTALKFYEFKMRFIYPIKLSLTIIYIPQLWIS